MSRCIEMELARFVMTSDLRRTVEPLILDALLEYAMRHRASQDTSPVLHLTLTQATDVIIAQQARWHKRLAPVASTLQLHTDGVPRKVGPHLHDLLRCAQEFFRREGAPTLRTASATDTAEGRFTILWTDFFSRCLLDWLRERDLIGDAGYLETADALVECAKLWIRELARLMNGGLPAFSDTERDVSVTLERGPTKLRVRGRPDTGVLRTVDDGLELVVFRLAEPDQAELQIAQLLLHMMLTEKIRGQPCTTGRLACFRSRPVSATGPHLPVSKEVEKAFAPFVGNEAVVRRLKHKATLSRCGKASPPGDSLLVNGAVGHGKTLLVRCYAKALGQPLVELHSASMATADDLINALNELLKDQGFTPGTSRDAQGRQVLTYPPMVLFFDDLQGLRRRLEPWHGLLHHPKRQIEAGERVAMLPHATVIAATQDAAHLSEHLTNPFHRVDLERYRHEDIARMVTAIFDAHELTLPPALAHLMAVMGRCNPMRAKLFASELRDRHRAHPETTELTREALMKLARTHWQVDEHGLSARDYQYLQALESGPRGLPALQQLLPMKGDELTVHIEPYLQQIGAIRRNSRGRSITVLGEQLLHRHRAGRRTA